MNAKRKVGKSLNVRKLVKHVKEWRLDTENMNKVIKKYPEKFKPEAKKSCTNEGHCQHRIYGECVLKDEFQLQCRYWKPRQEEIEVTIGFINEGNYDFEVMCSDNDRLRELIPKGSTQKFKLIKVEEK